MTVDMTTPNAKPQRGLRLVALWVGAKGILVLLAGVGALHFLHHDVHAFVERLLGHFHLNPARHYPRTLLDAGSQQPKTYSMMKKVV